MATKNLARTVIEGGRARYNKLQRRYSNQRARRAVRVHLTRLRLDPDLADEVCPPAREPVGRSHHDRLAPAEKWLASRVGQPWSDVRGEIARRFDTRTIAGQHIVFDHLLPSVRGAGFDRHWFYDFEVDDDGILRKSAPRRYGWHAPYWWRVQEQVALLRWTRDRKIGRRGAHWYWFEPRGFFDQVCNDRCCWRDHVISDRRRHRAPVGGRRQTRRLEHHEVARWLAVPPDLRAVAEMELPD